MTIRFLSRAKIDDKRWNALLDASPDSVLYARPWYLDAATNTCWGALVDDNYRAAMPLPWRRKYGIPYVFQPFLIQRLGIFEHGQHPDIETQRRFLRAIPWRFATIELKLQAIDVFFPKFLSRSMPNHVLDIELDIDAIRGGYNRNTRRNLAKAAQCGYEIEQGIDIEEFVAFQERWEPWQATPGESILTRRIAAALKENRETLSLGVRQNDELVAVGLFAVDTGRVYFLLCVSSDSGKEGKAMFFLIDWVIEKYSGRPLIFDFTGSNLESIARRNLGFGCKEEHYQYLRRSKIPV